MNLTRSIFENCQNIQKPAYVYKDDRITYEELFDQIAKISNGWSGLGISSGDRIIISLPDSPIIPILFLSAITKGIIPIIINPSLGLDSIHHIVSDSNAKTFITLATHPHIESIGTHVLIEDLYGPTPKGNICRISRLITENTHIEWHEFSENDAAFWQYTSGTTGLPKAVQHGTLTMLENFSRYCQSTLGVSSDAVFLSAAKMYFGYGAGASIFFPLLANATAIVEPTMPVSDLLAIQLISKHKPTHFFAAAPMYAALLKHESRLNRQIFGKITYISAGSNLPAGIYNSWLETINQPILDGIGATEVGHIFLSNSPSRHTANVTGFPISGYEYKLVDDQGHPCETKGRLLVKTNHPNLGYWKNAIATEKKFNNGWYDTGDLFYKSGNSYTYRGRADDLFKSNGIWVEPLAIESKLLGKFSDIIECALVPKKDKSSLTYPHLYIVSKENSCKETLLTNLQDRLLDLFDKHSAPKKISFIPALPRNDNGKVSRQQLISA